MIYTLENARSLLAVAAILFVIWLFSENKRRFPFLLALGAVAVQTGLILALFAIPNSAAVLSGISGAVNGPQPYAADPNAGPFIFGFRVLPLILVISALSALLWHWGVLKWITRGFGLLFEKTMNLGGAAALAVAANLFMGMVESPIVIRAYLDKLTRAELFLMMVVGLSTVAGSTMVAYALILGPVLPNAAGHVLVASLISAPAGILLARIMVPETHKPGAPYDHDSALKYQSSMDAITRGVQDGVMVAVNVAAFLIVFVAFVWIINNLLSLAPDVAGAPLTLQRIFGFIFAPVAYAIGLPWQDAQAGGQILGAKLFLTEFIAFIGLGAIPVGEIADRSRMILTYAICGFANVASVGIMTGGMTVLMPDRRQEILGLTLTLALAGMALVPAFGFMLVSASVVAALPEWLFAG